MKNQLIFLITVSEEALFRKYLTTLKTGYSPVSTLANFSKFFIKTGLLAIK